MPPILSPPRSFLVLIGVIGLLAALLGPGRPPGGVPEAAAQGNTVDVQAWICPSTVDATSADPAYFAETCTEPAAGLAFVLTRDGRPSTRETDVEGRVRPWAAVSGPFTLRGELPGGATAAVFCAGDGEFTPVAVADETIAGELDEGAALTCSWYLAPATASPTAATPTATTGIAEPTVASTQTPVPPTNTPEPTLPVPTVPAGERVTVELVEENDSGLSGTATLTADGDQTVVVVEVPGAEEGTSGHMFDSTCDDHGGATVFHDFNPVDSLGRSQTVVDAPFAVLASGAYWIHLHQPAVERGGGVVCGNVPDYRVAGTTAALAAAVATATVVPDLIAAAEPAYGLDIPTGLQHPLGDRLLVSPQPESRGELAVGDFVVEAVFANPSEDVTGDWDYGFLFGPTGGPDDYRLYVRRDGQWFLDLGATTVQSGSLAALNTAPRERNTLRLIVTGGTAFFSVNDEHVATLDVPAARGGGKLWLATSFQDERIQCWSHRVWLL